MNFDKSLFVNYWHLISHKNELSNDGDFIKFDTPIGDVVLFNDMGNLVAFDNKCPHRGAKIYTADSGNQIASCKYHRWAYRNSKIIVPDKHRFVGCDIDNVDLNKYQIAWCGDFIFLGISPYFELSHQLGNVFEILKKISFSINRRRDLNRYDFKCYWAIASENALEPYHVPFVHPKTLGILDLEEGEDLFDTLNSIWFAPIGNLKLKKQLSSMRNFFDISYQYEGFMALYLFPFTLLNSTFGYSYGLHHFFPSTESENKTNFTSRIFSSKLSKPEFSEFLDSFFESYAMSVRKVFDEDHEICKLIPRESWSMEPLKYPSELEEKINHFRQMCRESILN
jgi:phenylpropionate dioxygenase-like ring-hydroxylating dioxygenase large terminal subunit